MKKIIDMAARSFRFLIGATVGKKRARYFLSDTLDSRVDTVLNYGYLNEVGWTNSVSLSKSVNKNGEAIPWLTYPFLSFLEERINPELRILEFGGGGSTEYFSRISKKIVSFENDAQWFESIKQKELPNVELFLFKDFNDIQARLSSLNYKFDIILVDNLSGGERTERSDLTLLSLDYLTPSGIIILDDFQTGVYSSIIPQLDQAGFKRLNFDGIAPTITFMKSTTVCYRKENCLGI